MATKTQAATQKTDSTDSTSKISEALVRFGKDTYLKACEAAQGALGKVAGTDKEIEGLRTQINVKESGNMYTLLSLARTCVELTLKGKRAMLAEAADLMREACKFAEDNAVAEDAKLRNGTTRPIKDIVPSWPVMRSNIINAMGKAKIDPRKVAKPSAMEEGYNTWKKKNPSQVSNRGARPGNTNRQDAQGNQPSATPGLTKAEEKTAKTFHKLTDSARSAVGHLIQVLQTKAEAEQLRAAELISSLTKQVAALKVEEEKDAEAGIKTHRRTIPARESDRPASEAA